MQRISRHIEIVSSTVTGLSSMNEVSRDAIRTVLAKYYSTVGITIINDVSDLEALVSRRPDLVFLGMKFIPAHAELGVQDPDKIWISQYLDAHDILYTGSGPQAHNLERNKHLAKQRILDAGLKTSSYQVVPYRQDYQENSNLHFPLFVKPSNRGGGLGINSASLVMTDGELRAKILAIATDLQDDSLVEEYLPGREFSVAILQDEYSADMSVMPIELVTQADYRGARILGGDVKPLNATRVLEVTEQEIRGAVCTLATNVFEMLGARDYGRIDIRLDKHGVPHFLEANLLPSLISGYGSFPIACNLNSQLSHEDMVLSIVRLAFGRISDEPQSETIGSILASLQAGFDAPLPA